MFMLSKLGFPQPLSAIELAEGALLADIAVVLQLLSIYLPLADVTFRVGALIIFAVLVLRRRLYASIICLCVTMFIVVLLTGPAVFVPVLLEGGAGMFLGLAMRYRLHPIPLLLLGVTGGAITLSSLLVFFTLLAGLPLNAIVLSLHRSYNTVIGIMAFVATSVKLSSWWNTSVLPVIAAIAQVVFEYTWVVLFLAMWIFLWPIVIAIYSITNACVRILGYDVRPFPGGRVESLIRSCLRWLIRVGRGIRTVWRHRTNA